MGKFVTAAIGVLEIAAGFIGAPIGLHFLVAVGVATLIGGLTSALLAPGQTKRAGAGASVQIGEVARQGVFGEAAVPGSLVDAFNYGGKYGTDWTVLVIALADHLCESLEGLYVYNTFVPFTGDGMVAGYNNQLQVYFRPGSWDQAVPSILTTNAPVYPAEHPLAGTKTWTTDDRGRGVCDVVVAYKADEPDAKNPVWTAGQPTFLWVLKGLKTYSARLDDTVGGSGAHRWSDDTTRTWSANPVDCRYTWARGIYVEGHVDEPKFLLLGRGLSEEEAPPENVFAPANVCDELVALKEGGTEKRYTIGGVFGGDDAYIDTENEIAAACGGIVVDRAGSVELVPGVAETPVWEITDDDLVEKTTVTARDFRSKTDPAWCNMVSAAYSEPAQKWGSLSAPLRRVDDDVAADGEPRLAQPKLALVTSGTQAQRVGEIVRRKGRLWRTRSVVLGPRYAGVEHGDWLVWTSARYGQRPGEEITPRTFLVLSDAQGADWRNSLVLAEIAADVFDWDETVDELTPGSEAHNPEPPAAIAEPDVGDWTLAGAALSDNGASIPVLVLTGSIGDSGADAIVFDYRPYEVGLGDDDNWRGASFDAPTVARKEITSVTPGTEYEVGVRYRVRGIVGERRILGPVTAGELAVGGVRLLVSKSVNFPLSSNDDSINVAAFAGVLNDGRAISFPAASLTGLDSGTNYAVVWDIAGATYQAVEAPASAEMASSLYAFVGWQTTSTGGVFDDPEPPPPGYCVSDDTPILLSDGSEVSAGELVPGAIVRTRHERTMAWGDWPIVAISLSDEPVYACALEGALGAVTIRATAKHRFLLGGRWICADELGQPAGIARVAKITVAEAHTYVSAGVLSHNAKADTYT